MRETEEILHLNLDFLPLKSYANIIEGNALRIDWNEVVPKEELNYIMGNPPFCGRRYRTQEQTRDVENYFSYKDIDYVACWYKKTANFIQNTYIKVAFVSTNSITQGEQVAPLWKDLFDIGIVINFAYQTFIWNSEASLKAHVHCVIIGFSFIHNENKLIYSSSGNVQKVKNINAYLLNAPNIIIGHRVTPISNMPKMQNGNVPLDGDALKVEKEDLKYFSNCKYIKKLVGGRELLHNEDRYVLWLVNADPTELKKIPKVMERIQKCKENRLKMKDKASRKLAESPMTFRDINNPKIYIAVPMVSSEKRRYIPMAYLDENTIPTNQIQTIPYATIYDFGILMSNVHMSWMRIVAGRLEMRYRYSKDIVYNNFPMPNPTIEQKEKIEKTAQSILDARSLYPNSSLADLYDELIMPPELRKAHQENDKAVMEAYGFDWRKMTESDCVAVIIGIILIITILISIIIAVILLNSKSEKATDVLNQYISLINEKNYEEMYNLISENSKTQIQKEDFIKRNRNIYEGIDAVNIEIEITKTEKEKETVKITYNEKMSTSAGNINFNNTTKLIKENKKYKINWSSSMIFPELRNTDKVRISTIEANRGEIIDRNGEGLAVNGKILTVGIVPGKLGENKEQNISEISKLTDISTEYINTQISLSYVKENTFVPIKKISVNNTELKEKLLQIPGIMINNTDARVYPLGEETAHLIGYVQPINGDELKEKSGKGYNSESLIGKSGLEFAYEEILRGIDGKEIYIIDEKENRLKTLAKQDKKDGKDVKITIDSNMQKQLYNQMKEDKGFFVVMEPKTGELLACVSTPSYNSNDFVLGITNSKWEELNNDANKPLYNRFLQSYCPGSTFKCITAAIGLTTGKLTKDTTFSYTGLSWQKDKSWGSDYVTTLTAYNGTKNIENALIHSDNIFFAQAAMQIGKEKLCENLDKIGFNEQIEFPLILKKSQYSNSDKAMNTEKKLADSGYGQGDILVNPIHMASIYSAFANNGNMVKPYIEYKENYDTEYLKQNVFTTEATNLVKNAMIQVVENPEGTANDMKINGVTIAGKTGTAELKSSMSDNESGTLGWFDCFTVNSDSGKDMLIISMVENMQNNRDGGSHYLIKKIRTLFVK